MQKITTSIELRAAILALEQDQKQAGAHLKEELYASYQSLQPINILKSTIKEAVNSDDLKDDLITASVGVGIGYISKSLFEGEAHSTTKKLLGAALMFGVTHLVQQNPKLVKSVSAGLLILIKGVFYNGKA